MRFGDRGRFGYRQRFGDRGCFSYWGCFGYRCARLDHDGGGFGGWGLGDAWRRARRNRL